MDQRTKQEKIARFLADKTMSDAVYGVLLDTFLERDTSLDVQTLAAERIAINNLQDAWKVLERYKAESERQPRSSSNPGI